MMNNSTTANMEEIIDTLTDYLFSDKLSQDFFVEKNCLQADKKVEMNRELIDATLEQNPTPEQLDLLMRFALQTLRTQKKEEDFVIFMIDDVRYHVKRLPDNYTLYSRYQTPDFTTLADKFKEPIANDIEIIQSRFIELTGLYPSLSFVTFNNKDRYSSNEFKDFCIARLHTYYPFAYATPEMLALCEHFKDAFTPEQLAFIESNKVNSFQYSQQHQKSLEIMFSSWVNLLNKEKATVNNEFHFNDSDNHAFVEENGDYRLMSQRSQNTQYTYVLEKSTGRYKIWHSAHIIKTTIDDDYHAEMIADCENYLDMAKYYLRNAYGPTSYPVELNHKGYEKPSLYYLTHFDDDDMIVYDSKRGFNLHSDHAGNLSTDFELLVSVLDHYT